MDKNKEVYMIHDRSSNEVQSVYSRSYSDVTEFDSVCSARGSNCHDTYQDREVYKINKYKVVYELIEDDVDGSVNEVNRVYNVYYSQDGNRFRGCVQADSKEEATAMIEQLSGDIKVFSATWDGEK